MALRRGLEVFHRKPRMSRWSTRLQVQIRDLQPSQIGSRLCSFLELPALQGKDNFRTAA